MDAAKKPVAGGSEHRPGPMHSKRSLALILSTAALRRRKNLFSSKRAPILKKSRKSPLTLIRRAIFRNYCKASRRAARSTSWFRKAGRSTRRHSSCKLFGKESFWDRAAVEAKNRRKRPLRSKQ